MRKGGRRTKRAFRGQGGKNEFSPALHALRVPFHFRPKENAPRFYGRPLFTRPPGENFPMRSVVDVNKKIHGLIKLLSGVQAGAFEMHEKVRRGGERERGREEERRLRFET